MAKRAIPCLLAGLLGLAHAAGNNWILPDEVWAGDYEVLRLTFAKLPECTTFTPTEYSVTPAMPPATGGSIFITFQAERLLQGWPEMSSCINPYGNPRNYSQTFSLTEGMWKVYVDPDSRCFSSYPLCDTAYFHTPLDSINSLGITTLRPSTPGGGGPRARIDGGSLRVSWPEAASGYTVKVHALSGRLLYRFQSDMRESAFPLPGGDNEVLFLHLQAPRLASKRLSTVRGGVQIP